MFFIYINIFFIYFVCKNSSQSNFNQTYFLKTVIKNIFLNLYFYICNFKNYRTFRGITRFVFTQVLTASCLPLLGHMDERRALQILISLKP
jgi:hypothetical protein